MVDHVGIFITWTTYGTWLPGDQRGWRSRVDGRHDNGCLNLELECASRMKLPPVRLRPQDRLVVHEAIKEHCQIRTWTLYAANARTNHVHVVVAAYGAPKSIRDQLKANCTRRLRLAEDPLVREKTWTKGGDCDLLETEEDLEAAIRYVLECQ